MEIDGRRERIVKVTPEVTVTIRHNRQTIRQYSVDLGQYNKGFSMWVEGNLSVGRGKNEFYIEAAARPKHLNVWLEEFPSHCGGCPSVILHPVRIHDDGFRVHIDVSEGYVTIFWKYFLEVGQ